VVLPAAPVSEAAAPGLELAGFQAQPRHHCLAFLPSSFRWVVAGELARLLAAGARHADNGQKGDEGWQVLADAE
jgi:hypothetical protein